MSINSRGQGAWGVEQEVEDKNIVGLRLYVELNNDPARKTYEAMGMSSQHYTMYEWLR